MELQPGAFERSVTSYRDTGVADESLFVFQPQSFKPGRSLAVTAKLLAEPWSFCWRCSSWAPRWRCVAFGSAETSNGRPS